MQSNLKAKLPSLRKGNSLGSLKCGDGGAGSKGYRGLGREERNEARGSKGFPLLIELESGIGDFWV